MSGKLHDSHNAAGEHFYHDCGYCHECIRLLAMDEAIKPLMQQPHVERIVKEKAELDARLAKLDVFIQGDVYKTLPAKDQGLLRDQASVMREYSEILGERLDRFPK